MNQLIIKKVSKSFNKKKIVNEVSLHINQQEVVGLLGPNGAGKTTTFYIIVGLISADTGSVVLNNKDISKQAIYQRARSGLCYLPQESSIFKQLTVEENILIALESYSYSVQKKTEKLNQLLNDFSVESIRKNLGSSLSGGERRRVEIARSLAGSPYFLLLDEPFAGIDPIAVSEIQDIIQRVKCQGVGVLITDHNVRETLEVCDRSYLLKKGRVEAQGTSQELVKNKQVQQFYLGKGFKL